MPQGNDVINQDSITLDESTDKTTQPNAKCEVSSCCIDLLPSTSAGLTVNNCHLNRLINIHMITNISTVGV